VLDTQVDPLVNQTFASLVGYDLAAKSLHPPVGPGVVNRRHRLLRCPWLRLPGRSLEGTHQRQSADRSARQSRRRNPIGLRGAKGRRFAGCRRADRVRRRARGPHKKVRAVEFIRFPNPPPAKLCVRVLKERGRTACVGHRKNAAA